MNDAVLKEKQLERVQKIAADVRVVSYSMRLSAIRARDDVKVDDYGCLEEFIEDLKHTVRILQVAADSLQVNVNEKTREQNKRDEAIKRCFCISFGHDHKRSYPTVEEREGIRKLIDEGYLGKCGM